MNRNYFKTVILTSAICVSSCTLLNSIGGTNLSRRYKNTNNLRLFKKATDPQSFTQVEANSYSLQDAVLSPELKYNVLSLTREGQAQLIKSLENKFSDPKEFVKQLNTNFSFTKKSEQNTRVVTPFLKKSIIFTIDRLQYQDKLDGKAVFNLPGDRISYLQLQVKISDEKKARFNAWDRYVTDHLTLNLGKVTSAQNWSASVNLAAQANTQTTLSGSNTKMGLDTGLQTVVIVPGADIGASQTSTSTSSNTNTGVTNNGLTTGAQLGGNAGLTVSDSYTSSIDLTTRILKLSGSLGQKKLVLRQEGGQGIDLSGNVAVSINFEITDDWAKPTHFIKYKEYYDQNNNPIDFANLKSTLLTVIFPDIQNDITGTLDFSFLYRQVNHGNRHLPEARQKVTFWYGTVKSEENKLLPNKAITLIKKDEVRPKASVVISGTYPLLIKGLQPQFETVSEAAEFIHYLSDLIALKQVINGITINGNIIKNGSYDDLRVKTINL